MIAYLLHDLRELGRLLHNTGHLRIFSHHYYIFYIRITILRQRLVYNISTVIDFHKFIALIRILECR